MKNNTYYEQKLKKYNEKINSAMIAVERNMIGGEITSNNIFQNIISIGFEFETTAINPVFVHDAISVHDANTIGTPITNFRIKQKILINTTYDLFGEATTFELTPDFGNYEGDLQKLLNTVTPHPKYFRVQSNYFDPIKDYNIVVYDPMYYKLSNTEFVITCYDVDGEDNIIIKKFTSACKLIAQYIENIKQNRLKLDLYNNRQLMATNLPIWIDKIQRTDPSGLTSMLGFIVENEFSIKFKPQMTICILISNIIETVLFLLKQTFFYNKDLMQHYFCFLECANESLYFIMNVLKTNNRQNITVLNRQNPIINEFLNWLTLVIFNFNCYTEYKNHASEHGVYFKMFRPILLRHSYVETCPLSEDDKRYFVEAIQTKYVIPENFKYINTNSLIYLRLLLTGNDNYEPGIPVPDIGDSTMYPYNPTTKEILIEHRNFCYDVSTFLNNGPFSQDSISYEQIVALANTE